MKVHEYAKNNEMTNKEVMDRFGLTHHLQEIPEQTAAVEYPASKIEATLVNANRFKVGCGVLSHKYLFYVSAMRDVIPSEYLKVKDLIAKHL